MPSPAQCPHAAPPSAHAPPRPASTPTCRGLTPPLILAVLSLPFGGSAKASFINPVPPVPPDCASERCLGSCGGGETEARSQRAGCRAAAACKSLQHPQRHPGSVPITPARCLWPRLTAASHTSHHFTHHGQIQRADSVASAGATGTQQHNHQVGSAPALRDHWSPPQSVYLLSARQCFLHTVTSDEGPLCHWALS